MQNVIAGHSTLGRKDRMFASVVIIFVASLLLVYWFRQTCILLLHTSKVDSSPAVQARPSFRFGAISSQVKAGDDPDPLIEMLERDCRILTYLLEHAAGLEVRSAEERLLLWDYRLMRCWYKLTKTTLPSHARAAVLEMAQAMDFLAVRMTQRAGVAIEP